MNALALYRSIALLAPLLPRRAAYGIAGQASGLAWRRLHAVRAAVAANLRVVLDYRGTESTEQEMDAIARRVFVNFGKYVVDFFRIGKLSDKALNRLVRQEHAEYLEQCRAMGKGIVGLTGHIGNWEIGTNVLSMRGDPVNAIVLRQSPPALDALFQARRMRRGLRILPPDDAASSAQACLKRNELVVLLADLDYSRRAPLVPFFGRPARLPRGPAVLAARQRAPVLPAFMLRQADDTFRYCFHPPIMPGAACSADDIAQRIRAVLEHVISEHPDQWFAFEPLWPAAASG